jgi:hypothetical protein
MIWAFTQILDDDADDPFFKDGFDLAGYNAHNARIQSGTILFGKYYRSLWL